MIEAIFDLSTIKSIVLKFYYTSSYWKQHNWSPCLFDNLFCLGSYFCYRLFDLFLGRRIWNVLLRIVCNCLLRLNFAELYFCQLHRIEWMTKWPEKWNWTILYIRKPKWKILWIKKRGFTVIFFELEHWWTWVSLD